MFKTKQRISIVIFLFMNALGPILQMLLFPDILLGLFTLSIAVLIILFSMETPDYQLLTRTLTELEHLPKNCQ